MIDLRGKGSDSVGQEPAGAGHGVKRRGLHLRRVEHGSGKENLSWRAVNGDEKDVGKARNLTGASSLPKPKVAGSTSPAVVNTGKNLKSEGKGM